jgi:hypothetical protein
MAEITIDNTAFGIVNKRVGEQAADHSLPK